MARQTAASAGRAAIAAIVVACGSLVFALPGALTGFTLPKLCVMAIAVVVALFARRSGALPRWTWWIVLAGFVVLGAAAIAGALATGGEVMTGLVGRWPRYAGPLVTLPVAVGALWIGAALFVRRSPLAARRTFVGALAVAAVAIALIAVLEAFGLRPLPSALERPGSLLGSASDQGVLCAMLLVFLLAELSRGERDRDRTLRVLAPAGAVAAAVGVALSGSRGAYLAGLIGIAVVVALAFLPRTALDRRRAVVAGALTAAIGGVLVLVTPGALARVTGADAVAAGTIDDRWMIWADAWALFLRAPLLGEGADSLIDRAPAVHGAAWYLGNPIGTTLDSAHNWVLETLADGGIALLVVVVAGLTLAAREVSRGARAGVPLRAGAVAGVVTALAALLVHPTGPAVLLLGALLLGSAIGVPASAGGGPPRTRLTVAARTVGVLFGAVLVVGVAAEAPVARGVALIAEERAGDADAAFGAASALRPWDADLVSIAAQSFAQAASRGQADAVAPALRWAERATQRLPVSVPAVEARAVAAEAVQRWDVAVAARTRQTELAPADPAAVMNLAIDLAQSGRLTDAVTAAERARDLDPSGDGPVKLLEALCGAGADADACR